MKLSANKKPYEELPLIYNYLMRHVKYKKWADYVAELASGFISRNAKVLELAAGNCKFSNYMVKFYPHLIVCDISLNMLLDDRKNIVPKICCDMTRLPFKIKFDLIYSTFDSVNYLTSEKKLLTLFKEVSAILSDKGIFMFDVSMEKNSLRFLRDPYLKKSVNNLKYKHISSYSTKSKIHKNIFIIQKNNGAESIEIHRQKIYSFETYFKVISKTSLYVVECLEAFTLNQGNPESERLQFILKKVN